MSTNKVPKVILDDFRVSYVFDVEDPIPEDDLTKALEERGFKVNKQRIITAPPIRAVLLNLATYKHTSVMYQKEGIPSFIGAAGKDKRQVLDTFDILQNILVNLDPTCLRRSSTIEMVSTTKVFGEKLPEEVIAMLASSKVPKFEPIFGSKMRMVTTSFASPIEPDKPEWFVRIEPLFRSPRYYFVQLVYRDHRLANVLDISQKGEDIIRDVVDALERD
jgi:hypothetical protein